MPHLDLTYILENVTDDQSFIKELLGVFLREVQSDVLALERSIENKAHGQIKRDAHKVKSSFRSLGMSTMTERLQEIENLGAANGDINKITELYGSFKEDLPQILEEVRAYLK